MEQKPANNDVSPSEVTPSEESDSSQKVHVSLGKRALLKIRDRLLPYDPDAYRKGTIEHAEWRRSKGLPDEQPYTRSMAKTTSFDAALEATMDTFKQIDQDRRDELLGQAHDTEQYGKLGENGISDGLLGFAARDAVVAAREFRKNQRGNASTSQILEAGVRAGLNTVTKNVESPLDEETKESVKSVLKELIKDNIDDDSWDKKEKRLAHALDYY